MDAAGSEAGRAASHAPRFILRALYLSKTHLEAPDHLVHAYFINLEAPKELFYTYFIAIYQEKPIEDPEFFHDLSGGEGHHHAVPVLIDGPGHGKAFILQVRPYDLS